MKILLVVPSPSTVYGSFQAPDYPSLGLSYLGAVLEKAGHTAEIVDIAADRISESDFINNLREKNYGLVGITTTTPTFRESVRLTELVKKNSDAFTVLGGIHATVMPEESIKLESVDFVVKGEAEKTIIELVNCLEGQGKIESVDGICFKEDGKIIKNRDRELISNLDEIPFPARHLHKNQNYTYPDTLSTPVFPIITSRGCPAACTFCASNYIFKRTFRTRTPKNITDEIELLVKKYKAKEIHIWDDNFTLIKQRVLGIRNEIKKRNIRINFAFPNGLRVDCVDEDILKALREMGTYSIAFGVESGNQEVLNRVKKNIRLERVAEVFKLAKNLGIETWAFFILGLPGETESSIKETINFAKKVNPDIAKFHILKPFPGTEVFKELSRDNLIFDYNFDNYGIHTPPVHRLKHLDADRILDLQKRAYRHFYFRPTVLLRQINRLKSINRIKVNFSTGKNILKTILK